MCVCIYSKCNLIYSDETIEDELACIYAINRQIPKQDFIYSVSLSEDVKS